ncbi:unnamed protein product, partial [Prorocentrum cordatum]
NKWHQHLNLGRVGLSRSDHVFYTADADLYIISLSDNPDIQAARFGTFAVPPIGIRRADIYAFRAEPTQAEVRQLVAEAEEVAGQECRRRAELIGDLQVLRGLKVLVPPGCAAAAGPAALWTRLMGAWRVAACRGEFRVGNKVVGHVPTASRVGDQDILVLPSGEGLFVEYVTAASLLSFLQWAVATDARILPGTRIKRGTRELTWSAMVELTRLGIEGYHEHFRSICKLAASDWGVQEHFQLTLQTNQALCVDVLGATNLVSIETKFRRMQAIEFAHWDKAKDQESKGIGGSSR